MLQPTITISAPLPLGTRRDMLELLWQLERESKLPGQSAGIPGGLTGLSIAEAILIELYPKAPGVWTLSLAEIAARARRGVGCSRSTVSRLLPWLKARGFIHYEPRYRLEPSPDGKGTRARRQTSAFWIPPMSDFRAAYESQLRTARSHSQSLTIYGIRARPWHVAVDDYAAPEAPEPEEEIEHILPAEAPAEAPTAAQEEARAVMRAFLAEIEADYRQEAAKQAPLSAGVSAGNPRFPRHNKIE